MSEPDDNATDPKPKGTILLSPSVPSSEKPGDKIGRYKLLQEIGEGGMGTVWMAEQEEPVRRRVALKVIKLGMDTKQVIGRFEAERQALALMDHPNIAKVLDAGMTDNGRPFFVMELVKGIPITNYCDDNKLGTPERLKLFAEVCRAVQHAHQKGIIHRDIKPSNILVTSGERAPVPKVIDFGIAKATGGQQLTDKTLFTAIEQFIGTPAYMSPEQAEMNALDIDTRTDIYSLGVLLYELLTGRTPLDAKELLAAGLDGMRRLIREKEPERPSTRVSTLDAGDQTVIANCRRAEPPKLIHLIRGDLDWIAMKCLEKDRTRRYDTANGLAMDIERHLDNEPVLARPPSNWYRFQKMVRRNKVGFVAIAAVASALLFGIGLSTWMFLRERQARREAVGAERAQAAFRAQAEEARANEKRLRVQTGAEMNLMGVGFMDEGRLAVAERILRRAFDLHRKLLSNADGNTVMAAGNLAILLNEQGRVEDAEAVFNELLPPEAETRNESFGLLCFRAQYRVQSGRLREAAADMTKALKLQDDSAIAWLRLATIFLSEGDAEGYQKIRARMLARFGDSPDLHLREATAKTCLLLPWSGAELEKASQLARLAVNAAPEDKWNTLAEGLSEYRQGRFASAADWERRALAAKDPNAAQRAAAIALRTMALSQSGQADAALESLGELDSTGWKDIATFSPVKLFDEDWHNVLVAKIFLKEALALLGMTGKSTSSPEQYNYEGGCFGKWAGQPRDRWLEIKTDLSGVYIFKEFKRDNDTIELRDAARNCHLRLPVQGGMSSASMDGGATWHALYEVRKQSP